MKTPVEQIQAACQLLRSVRNFQHMRKTSGHLGRTASVHFAAVSFELCWQGYPGANNYHPTKSEGLCDVLAEALDVDATLARAEALLEKRIAKLRIDREAELRAELAEIEALKSGNELP